MIHLNQLNLNNDSSEDLAPDLTPMLDILFILLVFFMLTVGTSIQSLEVVLPSAVSKELKTLDDPNYIILEIGHDGFVLEGRSVSQIDDLRSLAKQTMQSKPDQSWIIASDKKVEIETVLQALTFLQSEGITIANILVQQGDLP